MGNHVYNSQIKNSLKEQELAIEADLSRHGRYVRDKCDHREIECSWMMDFPLIGQKTLVRADNSRDVETRRMEDFEKQRSLDLRAATDKTDAPDPAPAETASAPAESPKPASLDLPTPETAGTAAPGPELAPTAAERKKARDEETARKKVLREGTE